MLDIDPQIIKLGKILIGILMGLLVSGALIDFAHVSGLIAHMAIVGTGMLAGAGISIIGVFKEKDKEEDEE